jgi:hypothetical protein
VKRITDKQIGHVVEMFVRTFDGMDRPTIDWLTGLTIMPATREASHEMALLDSSAVPRRRRARDGGPRRREGTPARGRLRSGLPARRVQRDRGRHRGHRVAPRVMPMPEDVARRSARDGIAAGWPARERDGAAPRQHAPACFSYVNTVLKDTGASSRRRSESPLTPNPKLPSR